MYGHPCAPVGAKKFTKGNLDKEYAVKSNFVKIVWRLFSSVNVLSAFAQPLC